MSTSHIDIGYDLVNGIYNVLYNLVFRERDRITLTGTNGSATVVCGGVSRTATFSQSLTVTAANFVTAHAAAYLAVGIVLTSADAVLTFAGLNVASRFIGATSITNATLTLSGTVAAADEQYPIYKSIPKPSAEVYVHIHNLLSIENGTKDGFIYEGTIQIEVVDESKQRADKKLVQQILGVVRSLLKPARTTTFTIGSLTLIVFSPGAYGELIEISDTGLSRTRLIDTYNFLIE